MSVALGREQTPTTLKERVDRLLGIYPQLVSHLQNIETIDMRYQNGLALSAADLKIPAEGAKPKARPAVMKQGKQTNNLKPISKHIQ
jgi:cell division protein FtsQ